MDDQKITRRLLFATVATAFCNTVHARSGSHSGSRGRSTKEGSRGSRGLLFIGVMLMAATAWWTASALLRRKNRINHAKSNGPASHLGDVLTQPTASDVNQRNRLGLCPLCGKSMQRRDANYPNRSYFACRKYPTCLGTRPGSRLP